MAVTSPAGGSRATVVEPDQVARAALAGRREQALLDEPSVLAVARLLVLRCRGPAPWVRAAVGTLDRFAREVGGGDLAGLLAAARQDASLAQRSVDALARGHVGLTSGQLATLAFGPRLWWTVAGLPVAWRPLPGGAVVRSLPGPSTHPDVRLLLLAVIGTGATQEELLGVRVGDAGSLDADGQIVPDLESEPLAVSYAPAEGGPRRLTFLSAEAAAAVRARVAGRGPLSADAPLLLPAAATADAATAARESSAALIEAGNQANVTLCRATGDFFRAWGMPGARFDSRRATDPQPRGPA